MEKLLWKRRPIGNALAKAVCMWDDGVFLGIKGTTNGIIVGTKADIFRTRSVARKPMQERWDTDNLDLLGVVPWRKSDDDPNVDGEKLEGREMTQEEKDELKEMIEFKKIIPRRFSIRVQDIDKHGVTEGCGGCKALLKRKPGQVHSEACRARIGRLVNDERVKNSVRKENEFIEKVMKKDDEKRQKEADKNRQGIRETRRCC